MADATEIAVIRRKATHLVSLEKRSVMTKKKRLPALVAGIGPKITTDRSVNGSVAGNSVSGDVCRRSDSRNSVVDIRDHGWPVIPTPHGVVHPVHTRVG